jgi:hypothetical protein
MIRSKKTFEDPYFGSVHSDPGGYFVRLNWNGIETVVSIDCGSVPLDSFLLKASPLTLDQVGWKSRLTEYIKQEVSNGRIDFLLDKSDQKKFYDSLSNPIIYLTWNDDANDVEVCFTSFSTLSALEVPTEVTAYSFSAVATVSRGFKRLDIHGGD